MPDPAQPSEKQFNARGFLSGWRTMGLRFS